MVLKVKGGVWLILSPERKTKLREYFRVVKLTFSMKHITRPISGSVASVGLNV
jgi:hypothetical protein